MKRYLFKDSDSGGYTIVMSCLGETPEGGVVLVYANNINEAIAKFDKRFNIDSDYQSSYEGGSCSCCGRRFSIETDDKEAEDESENEYIYIYYRNNLDEYLELEDVYIIG